VHDFAQLARSVAHPDGLRSADSSYSTYLWARVVITQVIGSRDIVPSEGTLPAFQAARQIEVESARIEAWKKFFRTRTGVGLRFTIIRSDVGLSHRS
jgi:hypothetical protein